MWVVSILFFLYGILRIIYEITIPVKKYSFLSYPNTLTKHLIWNFPDDYEYVILIALFISIFMYLENPIFWISCLIYYFLPLLIVYITNKPDHNSINKNYNGSYWCWYVAIFAIILYQINPKIQKR